MRINISNLSGKELAELFRNIQEKYRDKYLGIKQEGKNVYIELRD